MRLYLLPISTRRTLLYCQPLHKLRPPGVVTESRSWADRATDKAARVWASWERKETGWQRMTVDYGNRLLRRVPYEEWGLKSVPSLSRRRRDDEAARRDRVELIFPPSMITEANAPGVLHRLGTERQGLHKKRFLWCFAGMPLTIPIGILPV